MSRPTRILGSASAIVCCALTMAQPRSLAQNPPDLQGVFQSIPDGVTLPGGLKNVGSPARVSLLPDAARRAKSKDLKTDPSRMCQPIGQFRMMAKAGTKIEIVQVKTMIVILFEDSSHGLFRTIYLTRGHPVNSEPDWMGDSVGRWEGDTLVVDTTGFNDQTWLNDEGAQHSDALHLVERIRSVVSGRYLEYKVTAEDPKSLAKPYSYTRLYKKLHTEIADDVCQDEE